MIKVNNLTKKFKDFTAVDNISLDIKEGEFFAFLGPNGAGKTTTIKMFTTLLKPSSGSIEINGFDVVRKPFLVRESFGIVFQDQSLDDELTAFENMEFHAVIYGLKKKERRQKIEELLKFVELWDRRKEFIKNFSGGMKRRLEMARGLIHQPKILFLDEPTLGLDPQTRNHIWGYIKELNQKEKLTVFFTTHNMEEAERYSNRIAVIDHGKIIALGSQDELKAKTKTDTLEEAFLNLTGRDIRDENASVEDRMRLGRKVWGR